MVPALRTREERDHPGDPIDPKKQISFADPEARCFTKKSDGTAYIYNSQAAVDMENQIIVENHIEDSVSDAKAAKTSLRKIEQEMRVVPDHLVMDSGYANTNTLEACEEHGVTPVCATSQPSKWKPIGERSRRKKRGCIMTRRRSDSSVLMVKSSTSHTGHRMASVLSIETRENVRSEWNLVCAAFNLKKIAALLRRKEVIGALEGLA